MDYATIAYSEAGMPLWTNRYNGPNDLNDHAKAIAVDGIGTVFATGTSGDDYVTIAYSAAGVALWTNRYNSSGNRVSDVAVDHQGNVFVVGSSSSAFATLAYSRTGVSLWTNRYRGFNGFSGYDTATAVAVDRQGSIFVTGYSIDYDGIISAFSTLAYSGAGLPLWTNLYFDQFYGYATDVAVDRTGNVFVTGVSRFSGSNVHYTTIAYSGAGVPLWTNRYDGPGSHFDAWSGIAVDGDGTVFVTGTSRVSGGNDDYATIAYSSAGVPLWTNRYNGAANGPDRVGFNWPIAVGRDGAVYVTGSSDGHFGLHSVSDYATIKYVWRPHLAIQPLIAGSSTVNLNVSGPANSSWAIERALMMSGPWTNLGLSLIGTNGSGTFRDVASPDKGAFYRAILP